MKKVNVFGNILFWLTLISPVVSFSLASVIGEADLFGVAGIIRYSWIMLLFVPFGVLSLLIGKKLKEENQSYKKNFIIAFICLPLLLIFGSYRFIFNSVTYDIEQVEAVEQNTDLELPRQVKIATNDLDTYKISYLKIVSEEETSKFESELESNSLWKKEIATNIKGLLPYDIQYQLAGFDYFSFYNMTSSQYNEYPKSGEYECIFVAYDLENQRMIILCGYQIIVA